MSQLSPPSQVVGDPTDPAGTLRPNLPPEPEIGDNYQPMPAPEFHHEIHLPKALRTDPIALFDLFFSPEQLAIIVASTNRYGLDQARLNSSKKTSNWTDISTGELYAYLGILIYIALHIENQTKDYWSIDPNRPSHLPVRNSMSRDRFEQISTAFHIADGSKSVFLKVI
jgi:Transposase IS4